jgi:hypothetical protein
MVAQEYMLTQPFVAQAAVEGFDETKSSDHRRLIESGRASGAPVPILRLCQPGRSTTR